MNFSDWVCSEKKVLEIVYSKRSIAYSVIAWLKILGSI